MIQSNLVVGIFQRQASLYLMCLDHRFQHIFDLHDGPIPNVSSSTIRSRYPISYRKYAAQIVRRVAPFSCQPAVVVVQPANHGSNVEGTIDRIKDVRSPGHSSTMRYDGALNDGPEKLGAFFESKGFKAAPDGIKEDITRGFILLKT